MMDDLRIVGDGEGLRSLAIPAAATDVIRGDESELGGIELGRKSP